jgi:hypothetical protein
MKIVGRNHSDVMLYNERYGVSGMSLREGRMNGVCIRLKRSVWSRKLSEEIILDAYA